MSLDFKYIFDDTVLFKRLQITVLLSRFSAGLLKTFNSAVALMRRPAVRCQLRSELAALPHQLVSYAELLAFFIEYGSKEALLLMAEDPVASYQDIMTASRLAGDLLPLLVPDNPRFRYTAAIMAKNVTPGPRAPGTTARACYLTMLPAACDVARQQGSDFDRAACGYLMAGAIEDWVAESAVQQGLPPPGDVLGWLQQAEAAHRRCKGVLPKQWTRELDAIRTLAAPVKASLQHMQQQGDRWRRLTPAAQQEIKAAHQVYDDDYRDPDARRKKLTCSGCGKRAPQLRTCGACREAQFCR